MVPQVARRRSRCSRCAAAAPSRGSAATASRKQQHQRGAHAGELPPGVAQQRPAGRPRRRCRRGAVASTTVTDAPRRRRRWPAARSGSSFQPPVTSASPTTISSAAADPGDPAAVAPDRPEQPEQPAEAQPEDEERQTEPEAVRDARARPPGRSDRSTAASAEHRAERRARCTASRTARRPRRRPARRPGRPPAAAGCRHSRCSPGTRPRNASPRTMMSTPTTISSVRWWTSSVRPTVATSDRHGSVKTTAKPATNSRAGDPATIRGRGAARRRRGRLQRVVEVGAGQTGHVGQVAGHQRQHARRQEADQPGERGHADRQHQRPAAGELGERVTHQPTPARRRSARRYGCNAPGATAPRITTAIRPCRSRMIVDGMAFGGTSKPSASRLAGSKRLG